MRLGRLGASAVVILALAFSALAAQTNVSRVVAGRVTGEGVPLASATVRLRVAGDTVLRVALTAADGRYRFSVPVRASQAILEIRHLGYVSAHRTFTMQAPDEPQDFDLRGIPGVLEGMTIRAKRLHQATLSPGAGSTDRKMDMSTLTFPPVDLGSIAEIAAFMNPGILTGLPDSTGGLGASIGGQPPSQTGMTVDGGSSGTSSLPSEAAANVLTVTSTYDVSRGQFSGGQVVVATRSGSDTWKAAVNVTDRDPRLQAMSGGVLAPPASSFARIGAGVGGPLVHDGLYVYGALDLSRTRSRTRSLDALSPESVTQLGFAVDSIDRLRATLGALGLPMSGRVPPTVTQAANGMLRFDVPMSFTHTLTTRFDWRDAHTTGNVSALSLGDPGAVGIAHDAGVLLGLNSETTALTSHAHIYRGHSSATTNPALALPGGNVLLQSVIGDSVQTGLVRFGGLSSPAATSRTLTELGEDAVFGGSESAHRLELGVVLRDDRAAVARLANTDGTFAFGGVQQLAAASPSLFTRTLGGGVSQAASQYAAAYAGDAWLISPGIRAVYGVRADGSRYESIAGTVPAPTALVADAVSHPPTDWSLNPRVGFTYAPPQGRVNVHGGVGAFRGLVPIATLAGTAAQTSTLAGTLVCTGAAAPAPDWRAFVSDPAAVPTACATTPDAAAGTISGEPTTGSVLNALVYSRDFTAPRVWHGSLGTQLSRRLMSIELEARYSLSTNQPTAVDRNLRTTPAFTLANEEHRPVFAAPDAIDPLSGAFLPLASRIEPGLGTVRYVSSNGVTRDMELSAVLAGVVPVPRVRQIFAALLYTYRSASERATGISVPGGLMVPTAGLPNERANAPLGFVPTHVLSSVLGGGLPIQGLRVDLMGSLQSGAAFTPIVGSDINGDGYANDRAFIFDPAHTADTALAASLARTIARATPATRACLERQFGTIAGAGSCRTPWSWTASLQLNYLSARYRNDLFSLTVLNAPAGLDLLLHGTNELRGWGQPALPDAALLYVRGFDAASSTFRYAANANFGAMRGAYGQPFGLQLRLRHTFGADPAQTAPPATFREPTREEGYRASLHAAISNTPAIILHLADSLTLSLDAAQIIALQDAADTLGSRIDAIADAVLRTQLSLHAASHASELTQAMNDLRARARAAIDDGVLLASGILRPDQWTRVPRAVREPVRDVSLNDVRRLTNRP